MARQPQPPPPANKDAVSPTLLKPVHGQVSPDQYRFPQDRTPAQNGPPGAGIDIASAAMPEEGILEVHDSDDDIRQLKSGTPEVSGRHTPEGM